MRHFLIVALGCIAASTAFTQWPTSTQTANALVLNYGFSARAVTFDDGSVIFSHGLPNSVYLTKLSADGYRMWGQQPVIAHYNDSSAFGGGGLIVSDRAGGAIVSWSDYRGALFNPITNQYYNNACYMQKVDSNGIVRWQAGGVLAIDPETGLKGGSIVTDGAGGVIYVTSESGFGYPGAPNRERLVAVRINAGGQKLWEATLDSTVQQGVILFDGAVRAGRYLYIRFLDYRSGNLQYKVHVVDTLGQGRPMWSDYRENVSWRDSTLFTRNGNRVDKLNGSGDSLWSADVVLPQGSCRNLSAWQSILPQERGGFYFLRVCNDSMSYVDEGGQSFRIRFPGLSSVPLTPNTIGIFPAGDGGLVWADEGGIAQRYDSAGVPRWGMPAIVFRSDPEGAYFSNFWPDNNGGILGTFWTTTRGLCVQHTGRFGQPGIVPVTESGPFGGPLKSSLAQNYPNPFNASTTLSFDVPEPSVVSLMVYDVLGRKIAELAEGSYNAGTHTAIWDGAHQASGVYFAKFTVVSGAGQVMYSKTNKLILMK